MRGVRHPLGALFVAVTLAATLLPWTSASPTTAEQEPSVTIESVRVDEGAGTVALIVTLSSPASNDVTVEWATADGTAIAPEDYLAAIGTAVIGQGETSAEILVTIVDDEEPETSESFDVVLSNAFGATLGAASVGTVTIEDNDAPEPDNPDADADAPSATEPPSTPVLSVDDIGLAEGDSGTTEFEFTVGLSAPADEEVTFDYETYDGSAEAPSDYTAVSGSGTIPAGETSTTITVLVNGDTEPEDDETFWLEIYNVQGALLDYCCAFGLILNDDVPANDDFADAIVIDPAGLPFEHQIFTGAATVETGEPEPCGSIGSTVWYAFTPDSDTLVTAHTSDSAFDTVLAVYAGSSGPWPSVIDCNDDGGANLTSILTVALVAGTTYYFQAGGFGGDVGPLTFHLMAGASPVLLVDGVSLPEGDSGTTEFEFTVRLSAPADEDVTFDYETYDDIAEAPSDYTAVSGSGTIPAGETSTTITVLVNGDTDAEDNESFWLYIYNPEGALASRPWGFAMIFNDDAPPNDDFADALAIDPADLPFEHVTYTHAASLEPGESQPCGEELSHSVWYSFTPDASGAYRATVAESWYWPLIAAYTGSSLGSLVELDCGFQFLSLELVAGTTYHFQVAGRLDDAGRLVFRLASGAAAAVSVDDVELAEGDAGATPFVFTVSLSGALDHAVTFDYASYNGSAEAPSDYTAVSGSGTIPAGETSTTITVLVNGDTEPEDNEWFWLETYNVEGAFVTDCCASGTILNDDAPPNDDFADALAIGPAEVPFLHETYSQGATLEPGEPVPCNGDDNINNSVWYSFTPDASGAYTASAADSEYWPLIAAYSGSSLGSLVELNCGLQFLSLELVAGTTYHFQVAGTWGGAGRLVFWLTAGATAAISIDDVELPEGDAGTTPFVFTVGLSGVLDHDVTFSYETFDGNAEAPSDYTAVSGSGSIPAGETSTTIIVLVNGDTEPEYDEDFWLYIYNVEGAIASDPWGFATILNDDVPPNDDFADAIAIDPGDLPFEHETYTQAATLEFGEPVPCGEELTNSVWYSFTPVASGAYTASVADSYWPLIAAYSGSSLGSLVELDCGFQFLSLELVASTTYHFQVAGTWGQAGRLVFRLTAGATAAINIDDVELAEGDAGTTPFVFTVSLSTALDHDVTFDYETYDDTAEAPSDYTAVSGSGTIPAGETSTTITVLVNGDTEPEDHEDFGLEIYNVEGAFVADCCGYGRILNDDGPINDDFSNALEIATLPFSHSVNTALATLQTGEPDPCDGDFEIGKSVWYSFTPDESGFYTAHTGSSYWPVVAVYTGTDLGSLVEVGCNPRHLVVELDESTTYWFQVSVPWWNPGGQLVFHLVAGAMPILTIGSGLDQHEGNSGTTAFEFTVSLSQVADQEVTFDYWTEDDSATAPSDYTAVNGSASIPAGETSTVITVLVNGDTEYEDDELFFLGIGNPNGALLGDPYGSFGRIRNDDLPPCPRPPSAMWRSTIPSAPRSAG
jgi:hypothetical protein